MLVRLKQKQMLAFPIRLFCLLLVLAAWPIASVHGQTSHRRHHSSSTQAAQQTSGQSSQTHSSRHSHHASSATTQAPVASVETGHHHHRHHTVEPVQAAVHESRHHLAHGRERLRTHQESEKSGTQKVIGAHHRKDVEKSENASQQKLTKHEPPAHHRIDDHNSAEKEDEEEAADRGPRPDFDSLTHAYSLYDAGVNGRLTGNYPLALSQLREAQQIFRSHAQQQAPMEVYACFELAKTAEEAGSYQLAKKTYEDCTQIDAKYLPARLRLARLEARHGDLDSALADARRAVSMEPRSAEAHLLTSIILEKTGNQSESMAEKQKALDLAGSTTIVQPPPPPSQAAASAPVPASTAGSAGTSAPAPVKPSKLPGKIQWPMDTTATPASSDEP